MKPLVITSKASFLSVRRHQLLFTDYINRTQALYRARQLPFDSIVVYKAGGNISFEAFRFLMQNGVPVIHLSWDGSQIAVTLPPGPISGELRIAQYKTSLDRKRREYVANALIREKVAKSVALLRFLKLRNPLIDVSQVDSVAHSSSEDSLERREAEVYWKEFAKVVHVAQPTFQMPARKQGSNNMGATDPVNSLLNYSYGILEARVRLALRKAGLDPELGFLHYAQAGATPLVYDMMELFRWVGDLTTVELLETKSIKPEDFTTDADYKVYLKEEAAHRVTERLSQNFNRTARVGGQNLRYETVLDADVRKIVRFVSGLSRTVDFRVPFIADDSWADSELAQRILSMTPEERKRLGVSKTTLWYARRNLRQGRPIRVYHKTRARLLETS